MIGRLRGPRGLTVLVRDLEASPTAGLVGANERVGAEDGAPLELDPPDHEHLNGGELEPPAVRALNHLAALGQAHEAGGGGPLRQDLAQMTRDLSGKPSLAHAPSFAPDARG